ncbi:MAG: HAMP domain-containing protein [bacterium]|nr:HAMP domain-containing protein [bacterium]
MKVIQNVNVGKRIFGTVFFLIILMAITTGFSLFKLNSIGEKIIEIAEEDIPLTETLTKIVVTQLEQAIWFERALRFGERSKSEDTTKEDLKHAEEEFEKLAVLTDENIKHAETIAEEAVQKAATEEAKQEFEHIYESLKAIETEHTEYESQVRKIFAAFDLESHYGIEALAKKIEEQEDHLDHEMEQLLEEIEKFTEKSALQAEQDEKNAIQIIAILTAVTLVFGIVLGLITTRSVTQPVAKVIQAATDVANGKLEGDFSLYQKDEIGHLADVFRGMREQIKKIMSSARETTVVLLDSVQDLTVSSQEISSTSNEQAAAIKEIVSTMEDSDQLAKSIAAKITDVTGTTSETKNGVNNGFSIIRDSLSKMDEIKTSNSGTISEVRSLGDKVESIWEIVNMINGIADQTKIIAFNAELEASSAGDAGKNFQIVASEIRRLADSTVASTSEIKAKITEIQHSSDSLIMASEEGTAKITEGWELSNNLQKVFEGILNSSEVSASATDQIALSINQQVSAFEQILLTLKQISEGIDNFVVSTRSTTDASEKLEGMANNLHTVIEEYVGNKNEKEPNNGE